MTKFSLVILHHDNLQLMEFFFGFYLSKSEKLLLPLRCVHCLYFVVGMFLLLEYDHEDTEMKHKARAQKQIGDIAATWHSSRALRHACTSTCRAQRCSDE